MAKTVKPSGLALSRKGNTFTASWKIGDKDYGEGQQMQRKSNGSWTNVPIGKTTKSKALTIEASGFYPYSGKKTVANIQFRVRGNRKSYTTGSGRKRKTINPSMSDWTTYTYTINVPSMPNITQAQGTWPQTTFSWTTPNSENTSSYWFTRTEYQSVLVQDSEITDGAKINWSETAYGQRYAANGSASGSLAVTEDSSTLNDGHSYTRWFRIRAVGPRGASNWRYSRHVYALSNQPVITDYNITKDENAQGYTCQVWFDNPYSESRRISQIKTEYVITIPAAGMACPDGASWSEGATGLAKDQTGGAIFAVDSLLGDDQCLFVRVNAEYDGRTTYGQPVAIDVGKLAEPTSLTVQTETSTHMATVTAANASQVPDSFLMIRYYEANEPDGIDIGIIPHGQTSAVVQCPTWASAPEFGVYAVAPAGAYTTMVNEDTGVTRYSVNEGAMVSPIYRTGGSVPVAPENVSAFPAVNTGTIRVTWDWTWSDADSAELSWADHEDAWESTDQPSTYTISKMRASAWNISGLETGIKWYVRVRLISGTGDEVTYGAYSDTVVIDLASAPLAPVLTLSEAVITADGQLTASWIYSTTDGTAQSGAVIAEVTEVEGESVYTELPLDIQTAQHVTLNAAELGWQTGETHALAVKVVSASGRESDTWSDARTVTIADPPTCTITSTSLETVTVETTDEEGQTVTDTVTALTVLPLTVAVEGAGASGVTRLIIERAAAYHVDRPDETEFNGHNGETIYQSNPVTGDATFTVELTDLIGHLDDGAAYRIVATVQDGYGQSASASIEFEVVWAHQPSAPTATVVIDSTELIAKLTPIAPAGAANTDVCDIYRLSVDKPVLIYEGATFGETYVDPYPTLGEFGGHRFVTRTASGDYIQNDAETGASFAWIDTNEEDGDTLTYGNSIINFAKGRIEFGYNLNLSSAWQKNFQQTQYLGGAVTGDWGQGIVRSGTVGTVSLRLNDQDTLQAARRLAEYPGICHIRTPEGSSYPADIQLTEKYDVSQGHKLAGYDLTITRVDQQDLDGMTLAEWDAIHPAEE